MKYARTQGVLLGIAAAGLMIVATVLSFKLSMYLWGAPDLGFFILTGLTIMLLLAGAIVCDIKDENR